MKKIINKVIVFTLIFNISIIINAISIRAAGDDDKKVYTELDENVRNIQDSKDACIGVEGETEPNEMIEYSRATTKPGKWIKASDGRWWYKHNDGTYTKNGWEYIDGKWYYFDSNGWMKTGWIKVNNKWYYLNSSGAMVVGWQKIGSTWYYFNSSGVMQTGWKKINNRWYFLESNGAMRTAALTQGGSNYTFQSSGALNTTRLGVQRQRQERTNWCWAASCIMVGRYDLPASLQTITQTSVVLHVKGEIINLAGNGSEEVRGINHASQSLKHATSLERTLSFTEVLNTIDNRHPFIVRMRWDGGGGHAVVCAGYRYSDSSLYLIDPWENTASRYYSRNSLVRGTSIATGTGQYRFSVIY